MKKIIIISIISVFILVISIIILVSCNSSLPEVGENPKDLSNLVIDNESHTITYQYLSEVDLSAEYFFGNILYDRKIYKNDTVVSQITFDPTGNNVYKVELIYKKTVISYAVILDTSRVVAVYGVNGTLTGYIFKDAANKINSSDLSSLAGASVVEWFTTSTFNQVANLDNYSSNAIYARGIDSYTLTFDSNGGSFVNSITKDKDSVITIPDNPTKAGYSFNGWYDNKQLNGDAVVFPYTLSGDVTLYAKWIIIDYSITYQLNGGTNHASNPDDYNVESNTITLQNPTKIGYTFAGWFNNVNFTGTPVTKITLETTEDVILYAKWEIITYQIEYFLNDGTNHASNPDGYNVETPTIALHSPTKDGHTFAGWFKEANFSGIKVTEITIGSTSNIILYAKWVKNDYSITYNLNGGTNHANNPDGYNVEDTIILQNPTRVGYTFDGWIDEDGLPVVTIPAGSSGDVILTATWAINSYTVTFDSNSGSSVGSITKNYNSTINKPDDPTRTGYTFAGWFISSDLSGNAVSFPYTLSGNVTLYAKWEIITYQIEYFLNDGTNHASNPDGYSIEDAIILQNPTRVGYTFAGWVNEDGIPTISILKGHTGNITLYAQWLEIYYIEYELNGGTNHPINPKKYDVESNDITLYNPIRVGYIFDGWFNESNHQVVTVINQGSTGNIKLYAKWKVLNYKIDYFLNSGTNHASNPANYNIETPTITFNNPTRNGYTFKGWFNDASFSGTEVTEITLGTTDDVTLYAKWEITIYNIEYNLNDGDDETTKCDDNPTTYTIETQDFTLEVPTRDGYTFEGWIDSKGLSVVTIPEGSVGNITLTATWTRNDYSITYNLDGGTNNASNPNVYDVESNTITLQNPTRIGYTFNGWINEDGIPVVTIPNGSIGNITLTATWTINSYTITFDSNDGSSVGSITQNYDTTINRPDDPTRTGYTFEGWFTSSDLSGNAISFPYTIKESVTLHAKWETITYNITYALNETINSPVTNPNLTTFTIESGTIVLLEPTRNGYEFTGWTLNDETVTEIPSGSFEYITLTATWSEPLIYNIEYNLNETINSPVTNPNLITFTIESGTIVLLEPTRNGYEFTGWTLNDETIAEIPSGSFGHLTLTAGWEITTYAIIYVLDGSDNSPVTNDENPDGYTFEDTITLKTPIRDGYTFEGWLDESNDQVFTIPKGSIGEITLTARWGIITYTAYFCNNDGSGLFYSKNFTIEDGITFPETPINSEREFIGWFTATDVMVEEFIYDTQEVKVFYAQYSDLPKIWQGTLANGERTDLYYMEFGMYPQTVVPLGELHDKLTNNYANQTDGVTKTGTSYTANKDNLAWDPNDLDKTQELNYEYLYLGERYVKVTPYACHVDDHKYNVTADNPNPEQIGQNSGIRWFKVEPIKWIILNINIFSGRSEENGIVTNLGSVSAPLELYAADVLIGGIQFNPIYVSTATRTLWSGSVINKYLNEVFYKEAFQYTNESTFNESIIYNNTGSSDYNNPAYGLNSNHFIGTGYNPTDQKIYLLSYYEMLDSASPYVNGSKIFASGVLASDSRKVSGTDYARAHNLLLFSGSPLYWTRTASTGTSVYIVNSTGSIGYEYAYYAYLGTRPALQLKPQS